MHEHEAEIRCLDHVLAAVEAAFRCRAAACAALWAGGAAAAGLTVLLAADAAADFGPGVRPAVYLIAVAAAAAGIGLAAWTAWLRRPSPLYLARLIEGRRPELKNSLLTYVELRCAQGGDPSMCAAVGRRAGRFLQDADPAEFVPQGSLRPATAAATASACVLAAAIWLAQGVVFHHWTASAQASLGARGRAGAAIPAAVVPGGPAEAVAAGAAGGPLLEEAAPELAAAILADGEKLERLAAALGQQSPGLSPKQGGQGTGAESAGTGNAAGHSAAGGANAAGGGTESAAGGNAAGGGPTQGAGGGTESAAGGNAPGGGSTQGAGGGTESAAGGNAAGGGSTQGAGGGTESAAGGNAAGGGPTQGAGGGTESAPGGRADPDGVGSPGRPPPSTGGRTGPQARAAAPPLGPRPQPTNFPEKTLDAMRRIKRLIDGADERLRDGQVTDGFLGRMGMSNADFRRFIAAWQRKLEQAAPEAALSPPASLVPGAAPARGDLIGGGSGPDARPITGPDPSASDGRHGAVEGAESQVSARLRPAVAAYFEAVGKLAAESGSKDVPK
jgi:hypothetical protein